MRARGIGIGVLTLIALQVLTSRGASSNVSGLFGWLNTAVKHLLDPAVPGLPSVAGGSGGTSGSTSAAPPGIVPAPGPGSLPPTPGLGTPNPQPGPAPQQPAANQAQAFGLSAV